MSMGVPKSTLEEELVIDAALLTELSRRGVRTVLHEGDVLRFQVVRSDTEKVRSFGSFAGGMDAGPNYAETTDETLRKGFGGS